MQATTRDIKIKDAIREAERFERQAKYTFALALIRSVEPIVDEDLTSDTALEWAIVLSRLETWLAIEQEMRRSSVH